MEYEGLWELARERWPRREDEGLYDYKRRLSSNVLGDIVGDLDPDTRMAFGILMGMLNIKPEE